MIIAKFGGTSVANAERISAVGALLRELMPRRPVVVLSALAGVTDLLEEAIDAACVRDERHLERTLSVLRQRHSSAIAGAVERPSTRDGLNVGLACALGDLRARLRSMRDLGEASARASDAVRAFGEQMSAKIGAAAFVDRGLPACWIDPRRVVHTDAQFGRAAAAPDRVRRACRELLLPRVQEGRVPVLGGYVGATPSGDVTTLGRGGSDTTAAVLGVGLEAEEIQIWTDVDGVMSADPKLVPRARTMPRVSFAEAEQLSRYGARVLHPAAVALAAGHGLPIRVLNSLRPERPGTLIGDAPPSYQVEPAAVTCRQDVSFVRVAAPGARNHERCVRHALRGWMGMALELVVASEEEAALLVPRSLGVSLRQALGEGVDVVELAEDCAVVCVVGPGLGEATPERERVVTEITRSFPKVLAFAPPSSTGVAAVVSRASLRPAIRRLHERLLEQGAEHRRLATDGRRA